MSKNKVARSASLSKGRRLTAEEKTLIASAPMEVTNTELAEKYSTTLNTIGRYRKGSRRGRRPLNRPGRPAGATAARAVGRPTNASRAAAAGPGVGFKAVFEGGEMVIRLSRSQLLRLLADMPG
jgi:hypothetical protein